MSIKFENTNVLGFDHAIRGMRNPMNSWWASDSDFIKTDWYIVGPNDIDLMSRLVKAGTEHRKFMRMITVYTDITAPLYWWKQFDTYKIGTVANSCSTMHKITDKEFDICDFSHEHLEDEYSRKMLEMVIETLNFWRYCYIHYNNYNIDPWKCSKNNPVDASNEKIRQWAKIKTSMSRKDIWYQIIQLLPSSYNQKRTVMMNYEVLINIYNHRKTHKLDEWSEGFVDWIKHLPYSRLIVGEEGQSVYGLSNTDKV